MESWIWLIYYLGHPGPAGGKIPHDVEHPEQNTDHFLADDLLGHGSEDVLPGTGFHGAEVILHLGGRAPCQSLYTCLQYTCGGGRAVPTVSCPGPP
jgi:hypothetical protein